MINALFLIFITFLLSIAVIIVLSSTDIASVYGQTSRDTNITSVIDGFNNPVLNESSTTSNFIDFYYSEVINNQPQVDKFKCRLDNDSLGFVDCTNFIDSPTNFTSHKNYTGLSL